MRRRIRARARGHCFRILSFSRSSGGARFRFLGREPRARARAGENRETKRPALLRGYDEGLVPLFLVGAHAHRSRALIHALALRARVAAPAARCSRLFVRTAWSPRSRRRSGSSCCPARCQTVLCELEPPCLQDSRSRRNHLCVPAMALVIRAVSLPTFVGLWRAAPASALAFFVIGIARAAVRGASRSRARASGPACWCFSPCCVVFWFCPPDCCVLEVWLSLPMVWPLWLPVPTCRLACTFSDALGDTLVSPVFGFTPTLCAKASWLGQTTTKPVRAETENLTHAFLLIDFPQNGRIHLLLQSKRESDLWLFSFSILSICSALPK